MNPKIELLLLKGKGIFFSERYLKFLFLFTKSSIVTADKLFNTESRDDIAAENKATSVSPTIPIGKLSIRKIGTAKLKLILHLVLEDLR